MSDRFKVVKTYFWDRVDQTEPSDELTSIAMSTELVVNEELSVFENNLLNTISNQILDENFAFSLVGMTVGALLALAWFKRFGKHFFYRSQFFKFQIQNEKII